MHTVFLEERKGRLTGLKKILIKSALLLFCLFQINLLSAQVKFIENDGQWDNSILYRADLPGGRLFVQDGILTYCFIDEKQMEEYHDHRVLKNPLRGHAIKVKILNSRPASATIKKLKSTEYYNFFIGSDSSKWASGVYAYQDLTMKNVYKNIDMELVGQYNGLKYNFVVNKRGHPSDIKLSFSGTPEVYLKDGNLNIETTVNKWVEESPYAYQIIDDSLIEIPCNYTLKDSVLSFELPGGFNKKYPLVIDPKVIFSTYSGSYADNFGYSATFDRQGHGYSAGTVFGPKFPVTTGAFQTKWDSGATVNATIGDVARDIGIIKYNPVGTSVVYITYLGGSHNEDPHSMIVDRNGDLFIMGNTGSKDFPMKSNSYDTTLGGSYDIFIAKLSGDGKTLKASTFVGGSSKDGHNGRQYYDAVNFRELNSSPLGWNFGDMYRGEIITDSSDNVLVATSTNSTDFPTTSNALQRSWGGGNQDGCVVKLNNNLSKLMYATYYGGNKDDAAYGIAIDPNDSSIVFCGGTASDSFSNSFSGAYQDTFAGGIADGFIVKTNPQLSKIKASTLFGTNYYDQTYFVQVDKQSFIYVTGQTKDTAFPVVNSDYSIKKGLQFVTKFDSNLDSIEVSATFGSGKRSEPDLSPSAFLVDTCGRIYFSGWGGIVNFKGSSSGIETTSDALKKTSNGSDFYIAVFGKDMSELLYATYYGGNKSGEHVDGGTSRFDKSGIIYQSICAGCGNGASDDLPTTPNAWSRVNRGIRPNGSPTGCNNALIKIDLYVPIFYADFDPPSPHCVHDSVRFKNTSKAGNKFYWIFDSIHTSTQYEPVFKYADTGWKTVKLIVYNPLSCVTSDTIEKKLYIYDKPGADFDVEQGECINTLDFSYKGKYGNFFHWDFGDGMTSTKKDPTHTFKDTGLFNVTLLVDSGTACADTFSSIIKIDTIIFGDFNFSVVDSCAGSVQFNVGSTNASNFIWLFENGDSSYFANPKITFKDNDTNRVKLVFEPYKQCRDTISKTVFLEHPVARADYEVIDSCQLEVQFRNKSNFADSLYWDFGNGNTSNKENPKFKFSDFGKHKVTLIISGSNLKRCIDTLNFNIMLDTVPRARMLVDSKVCSPEITLKNKSLASDYFQWTYFNGLNVIDTTTQSLSDSIFFLVKKSGKNRYAELIVSSTTSTCKDSTIEFFNVDSFAYADFEYLLDSCKKKLIINKNKSYGGDSVTYFWDFGDLQYSKKIFPDHIYNSDGNFLVSLFVEDGGCFDRKNKPVEIKAVPEAKLNFFRPDCSPEVNFQNLSKNASKYLLTFGDGDSSLVVDTIHVYPDTVIYQFTLIGNPNGFCPDTFQSVIKIDTFAYADFNYKQDSCSNYVQFSIATDSFGSYAWDFGDGTTSKEKDPGHKFPGSGTYTVISNSTNNNCQDSFSAKIKIAIPKVDFSFSRDTCSPIVKFTDESLFANNYEWDFGNDSSSFDQNPIISYADQGKYKVRLVINNNSICSDTLTKTVNIGPFIVSDFISNIDTCLTEASFINKSKNAVSYKWLFGDHFSSTEENPLHRYDVADSYTVHLIAKNNFCIDTATEEIVIKRRLGEGFEIYPQNCTPSVYFKNISEVGNDFLWEFGDGETSKKKNPIHTYSDSGFFQIVLTVDPGTHCEDTLTGLVEIEGRFFDELIIPNVFTPNDDGYNDNFVILGLNDCKDYKLQIYNRWGKKLFEQEGTNISWNGKYKNDKVAEGTYFYILWGDGEEVSTGTITVIR